MGCSGSKVEQQKAVALCRGRADLLAAAIHHRDALASAHAAYSDSLLSVSAALHSLLVLPDSSPVLPLTSRRKSEPSPPPTLAASGRHSDNGSHINFLPSDSDSDDDNENENDNDNDDYSPFHYGGSSPVHHLGHYPTVLRGPGPGGDIYYARSQPPPSVTLAQTSQRYETVQVGSFDPYSAHPSFGDPYTSYFPNNYGSMGGFFGLSSSLPAMPPSSSMAASASSSGRFFSSKAPPPPPSPPRISTWDFFNPFQVYDDYYTRYAPSWSSREARDEEGIPDLEEANHEVVKEVAFSTSAAREMWSAMGASARREHKMNSIREGSYLYDSRSPAASRDTNHKQEAVDKNGVQRRPVEERNAAAPKKIADFSMAAVEIKAQFERASQGTGELSKLLEVGNHRHYHLKHSLYAASSRMIGAMTASSSNSGFLEFDDDKGIGSRSLASTLQKLHIWERKLYHEVRDEEKMRLLLSRSHKELKRMIEKGAEAAKIDSMRNLIKKLSTKIRIALKVVDSISKKINRIRDEELWPRITELVLGILRMWNTMLECHQMQCQAMSEIKGLDSVISSQTLSSIHANRIMELEFEVLKWTSNFSAWINAQRNYVKALNGWLILCLRYEPEETTDGVAPYSPRRIGAPPVFIICNSWSQAMDRPSERGVLESMESFAAAVRRLWEQQNIEQHERVIAVRDMDRWIQVMEKNKRHIRKEVDSLNKKLALVPGQIRLRGYPLSFEGYIPEASSIQLGLERIFEAMQDYTASSAKAYQQLLQECEEQQQVAEDRAKSLGGNQEGCKQK